MKINIYVNDKKMKINVVKSQVQFLNIKVFIQDSNGLYTSYFYHMIKTHI